MYSYHWFSVVLIYSYILLYPIPNIGTNFSDDTIHIIFQDIHRQCLLINIELIIIHKIKWCKIKFKHSLLEMKYKPPNLWIICQMTYIKIQTFLNISKYSMYFLICDNECSCFNIKTSERKSLSKNTWANTFMRYAYIIIKKAIKGNSIKVMKRIIYI